MLTAVLPRTALADRINDGGRVISFSKIAAPEGRHVTSQVVHANGGAYAGPLTELTAPIWRPPK